MDVAKVKWNGMKSYITKGWGTPGITPLENEKNGRSVQNAQFSTLISVLSVQCSQLSKLSSVRSAQYAQFSALRLVHKI